MYTNTKNSKAPVKRLRGITREVSSAINISIRGLIQEIEGLLPWLEKEASATQVDAGLRNMLQAWNNRYGPYTENLVRTWIGKLSSLEKKRLEVALSRALRADNTIIIDDEVMRASTTLMSIEARNLIMSIPEQYLFDVSDAVLQTFKDIPHPEGKSLTEQVFSLGHSTRERANLIARDQTSKIITAVNQARQQSVGIEEYIWRTAGDRRVVGNPSGAYPNGNKVHGNHYARNGKTFRWDKPPSDGHPGYAIGCRCIAEPIIRQEKITALYTRERRVNAKHTNSTLVFMLEHTVV